MTPERILVTKMVDGQIRIAMDGGGYRASEGGGWRLSQPAAEGLARQILALCDQPAELEHG